MMEHRLERGRFVFVSGDSIDHLHHPCRLFGCGFLCNHSRRGEEKRPSIFTKTSGAIGAGPTRDWRQYYSSSGSSDGRNSSGSSSCNSRNGSSCSGCAGRGSSNACSSDSS